MQERYEDDTEDQLELKELPRSDEDDFDGEEGASDYDDDAASEASSEALALAVATEEAAEEEMEAAKVPKEPRQGLTRLGCLLLRRADAQQEGQAHEPLPSVLRSLLPCGSRCLMQADGQCTGQPHRFRVG